MDLLLLPTHHCFDDALEFISERVLRDPSEMTAGRLVLVHGIAILPEGPEAGQPFAHAWVEEAEAAGVVLWQAFLMNGERVWLGAQLEEIYTQLQVGQTWRYSVPEAAVQNMLHVNFGPWAPELQGLLRKKGGT